MMAKMNKRGRVSDLAFVLFVEKEKIFKKSQKISKKVLTILFWCDILHERSQRVSAKRSLKIEQQK